SDALASSVSRAAAALKGRAPAESIAVWPPPVRGCSSASTPQWPADGSSAQDGACLPIHYKVVLPIVLPRVKQGNLALRHVIGADVMSGLVEVASATRKGPIRFVVRTLAGRSNDVLDLKGKVEDGLWSVTVFAAVAGLLRHKGIVRVHGASSRARAAALAPA